MIKDIPYTFKATNEEYLVVDALKTFCNEKNLKTSGDKSKLISNIIEFANINNSNKKNVLEWFEKTLKEGIKNIFIRKINLNRTLRNKPVEYWEKLIKTEFNIEENSYMILTKHIKDYKLQSYNIKSSENTVNYISLNFSILLNEKKSNGLEVDMIQPIYIDIDFEKKCIIARIKSKSNIYKYVDFDGEIKKERTDATRVIIKLIETISKKLDISLESRAKADDRFKSVFYDIISECTKTPEIIKRNVESEKELIQNFINDFFNRHSINLADSENYINACEDIENFMEKYLSINHIDQTIFTKDRYAYPIKITATDSDFSSIEESSYDNNPLQCSPIFYDNKKVINREKSCNILSLRFKTDSKVYFRREAFNLTARIKKGYCVIQLLAYVREEEISHVLSRFIRN